MSNWRDSVDTAPFGIRVHRLPTLTSVRVVCEEFLDGVGTHCIFTPNPEILLYARKHPDYAALLNEADLALPDGFGLVLVSLLGRGVRMPRWPGIDVAELILRLAAERGERVLFLGGRNGIGDRAAVRWRARMPGLDVVTAGNDIPFGLNGIAGSGSRQEAELEERIRELEPAVIFVSLGHPRQERWIGRHRFSIQSARIMMGVGGALDMWGSRYSRAPGWLRSIGLEWAWRVLQQPARLPRTLRATTEFPVRALAERRR
jgi:N-acetylglucosaminyldiphosphoundecaprenol N-acetyl-beta-D-mannosaminyltransferase